MTPNKDQPRQVENRRKENGGEKLQISKHFFLLGREEKVEGRDILRIAP